MTQETTGNWEKEFDKSFEYESEGCSECSGYSLIDKTQTPYPHGTYHQEYDLQKIKAFIHHQLQKAREEERERIAQGLPMKGDMGKLTPFQETVNTYIANRLKELSGSQE